MGDGASPQLEDGHTRIANELFEAIIALRCPGRVKDLIWAVARETYGWHETARAIPRRRLGQLLSGDLGEPLTTRYVRQLIGEAEAWNLIVRDCRTLSIQKDHTRWAKPEVRGSGFGDRKGRVPVGRRYGVPVDPEVGGSGFAGQDVQDVKKDKESLKESGSGLVLSGTPEDDTYDAERKQIEKGRANLRASMARLNGGGSNGEHLDGSDPIGPEHRGSADDDSEGDHQREPAPGGDGAAPGRPDL